MTSSYQMDANTQLLPEQPPQTLPAAPSSVVTGTSVQAMMQSQSSQQASMAQPLPTPTPTVVSSSAVTEVPVQAVTQLRVSVPSGSAPGQEVQFTTPDGRRMSATVPEGVAPGSVLTVQYPNSHPSASVDQPERGRPMNTTTVPAAPQPPQVAASVEHLDQQAMRRGWWLYAAGWLCCCFHPFIGACIWVAVAGHYYCKPKRQQQRLPRQSRPAAASAITCMCLTVALIVMGITAMAVVGYCGKETQPFNFEHCPRLAKELKRLEHHGHHHWRHHWHHDGHGPHGHHRHSSMQEFSEQNSRQQDTFKEGLTGFLHKDKSKFAKQVETAVKSLQHTKDDAFLEGLNGFLHKDKSKFAKQVEAAVKSLQHTKDGAFSLTSKNADKDLIVE